MSSKRSGSFCFPFCVGAGRPGTPPSFSRRRTEVEQHGTNSQPHHTETSSACIRDLSLEIACKVARRLNLLLIVIQFAGTVSIGSSEHVQPMEDTSLERLSHRERNRSSHGSHVCQHFSHSDCCSCCFVVAWLKCRISCQSTRAQLAPELPHVVKGWFRHTVRRGQDQADKRVVG